MAIGNVFNADRNLPHYKSRREAGIGKEEPIYSNLWLATIIPPPLIQQSNAGDLLNAQVTSVGGLETDKGAGTVEQVYRGAQRSYAGAFPESTVLDLTFNFNYNQNSSNQLYVYKILRDWAYLVHNPITGTRGKKVDYVGQCIIEYHDRAGDIYRRVTCYDMFPTEGVPDIGELVYEGGDIMNLEGIAFRSDYYEVQDA